MCGSDKMAGKRVRRSLDDLDSPDLFSTADALPDLSKVAKLRQPVLFSNILNFTFTTSNKIDNISRIAI